jgi:hypothetical protein
MRPCRVQDRHIVFLAILSEARSVAVGDSVTDRVTDPGIEVAHHDHVALVRPLFRVVRQPLPKVVHTGGCGALYWSVHHGDVRVAAPGAGRLHPHDTIATAYHLESLIIAHECADAAFASCARVHRSVDAFPAVTRNVFRYLATVQPCLEQSHEVVRYVATSHAACEVSLFRNR